jgi:hypothetical protein
MGQGDRLIIEWSPADWAVVVCCIEPLLISPQCRLLGRIDRGFDANGFDLLV